MALRAYSSPAWLRGGLIGFAVCGVLFVIADLLGWLHLSGGGVVAIVFVCLVLGFIPGVLVAMMKRLFHEVRTARPLPYANDGWTLLESSCVESVERFRDVLAEVRSPDARNRLAAIGVRLDAELDETRKLTEFGREMDPYVRSTGPDDSELRDTWDRLTGAEHAFDAIASDADSIRASLAAGTAASEVGPRIDALHDRLPRLRGA